MRVNEIIVESEEVNEGFWDTLKAVGSGLAGIPKGNAGAKFNQGMGANNINDWAKTVAARWQKEVAPAIQKGTSDKQYKAHLDKWLGQYLGGDYSSNLKLTGTNDPSNVAGYIKQAVDAERLGTPVKQKSPKAAKDTTIGQSVQDEAGNSWTKTKDGWLKAGTTKPLAAGSKGDKYLSNKLQDEIDARDGPAMTAPATPATATPATPAKPATAKPATATPATAKPVLNIPAGANPREVEEYKKRHQQQLDTWNKYNNSDYEEDDWAAAMGEPAPVPALATGTPASTPAPNWQVIGGVKYDLNDPKNAKLAKSVTTGKDSLTGDPVTMPPSAAAKTLAQKTRKNSVTDNQADAVDSSGATPPAKRKLRTTPTNQPVTSSKINKGTQITEDEIVARQMRIEYAKGLTNLYEIKKMALNKLKRDKGTK